MFLSAQAVGPWWMPERPDTIYAAAIGGLIALLTTWLGARNTRKRQNLDLAFAASEKEKERQYSLRRETYISLMEAFSSSVLYIVRIPTVAFEELKTNAPAVELGRGVARLGLIAPPGVQTAVQKYYLLLTQLSFELIQGRLAIEAVVSELGSIDFDVQLRLNRQKELQMRQEKHIDGKTDDPQLMQHLYELHCSATAEINGFLARRGPLLRKKSDLEFELQSIAVDRLPMLTDANIDVTITIRQELGLSTNDEWIRKFGKECSDTYTNAIRAFQAEIKKKVMGDAETQTI